MQGQCLFRSVKMFSSFVRCLPAVAQQEQRRIFHICIACSPVIRISHRLLLFLVRWPLVYDDAGISQEMEARSIVFRLDVEAKFQNRKKGNIRIKERITDALVFHLHGVCHVSAIVTANSTRHTDHLQQPCTIGCCSRLN